MEIPGSRRSKTVRCASRTTSGKIGKMQKSARAFFMIPAILLIACHGGSGKGPRPLTIANGAEPASLDPHAITGAPEIRVAGTLFEGLVVRGLKDHHVRPGAAKSWDVSADGKAYTFHVRFGSKW